LSREDRLERALWDRAINGIYLGSHSWAKSTRKWIESKPRSTDHPKKQRSIGRPKMHAAVSAVAKAAGETATTIRAARGGTLRRLAAWIG
jgi:hypothetical protein